MPPKYIRRSHPRVPGPDRLDGGHDRDRFRRRQGQPCWRSVCRRAQFDELIDAGYRPGDPPGCNPSSDVAQRRWSRNEASPEIGRHHFARLHSARARYFFTHRGLLACRCPHGRFAAEIDRPTNVNGSDSAVARLENDETKPIVRPEAG
jgi:hypothetical protein